MRHLQKSIILLFILLLGCSHTKIIKTYELEKSTALPKIHKYDQVQLTFANGETQHVKKLIVSPDSTTFFDVEKNEDMKIATSGISSVSYRDPRRGRNEVSGIGILVGATYGYLTGLEENRKYDENEACEEWPIFCFRLHPIFYGLAGGFVGGLLGILPGTIIGSKITYYFHHSQEYTKPKELNDNLEHISKD